jgi:two-component system chemotaxis response regulator CheB
LVDDSSAVRAALAKGLRAQGIDVVGGAADPYMARDLIFKLDPDVLTLDLQMPHMDGLSFLAKLMTYKPLPVVVLSSLTNTHRELALQAMELGAVEVFPKPDGSDLALAMQGLARSLRGAARSRPRRSELPPLSRSDKNVDLERVVAVGASTGGTNAIQALLSSLSNPFPPLLIVQHMPPGFTDTFAQRLDRLGKMRVAEAHDGDLLVANQALLAPGGQHMRLERGSDQRLRVRCAPGEPVHHVCPSVDVLFHSVAQTMGSQGVGVLLTGMGRDGAEGLLAMRQRGAATLAQDEASSVVWGMPGEAQRIGAADSLVPLSLMGNRLASLLAQPVVC